MKLALALLADYALAHETDGKLYVTGGGIRVLRFADFPAVQPHLALALGIEVAPEDFGDEHALSIVASGPTDATIIKPVNITFTVPPALRANLDDYFHFVSNMDNASFPEAGTYTFSIALDTEPPTQVTIRALQSADGRRASSYEASSMIREGFEAFASRDVAAAEAIFRKVTERFPAIGEGHNNLGFVLLARGDAATSIEVFRKAKQLGYAREEISDANIGCALYLSGDPTGALRMFEDCLRTRFLGTPATLFGIGPEGLFAIGLKSAADYSSLMALNAAWSADAVGDAAGRARFLEVARVGEALLNDGSGAGPFHESVIALEAKQGQSPR
jgi:tetratricopeptide (TPR) repeat protein